MPPSPSPSLFSNAAAATTAPPQSPLAALPPKPATRTIAVREGDTLFSLAQKHNVSVQAITQANQLDEQVQLQVGQKLKIPVSAIPPPAPKSPEQTLVYRVRRNDTVESIAHRFALPAKTLIAENKIAEPGKLVPGQWLVIPGTPPTVDASADHKPPSAAIVDEPFVPPFGKLRKRLTTGRSRRVADLSVAANKEQVPPPPPSVQSAPAQTAPLEIRPKAKAKIEPVAPPLVQRKRPEKAPAPVISKAVPTPQKTAPLPSKPLIIPDNTARGLYLAHHALSSKTEYAHIIELLGAAQLNALVIDFKDEWGYLSHLTQIPLAKTIGAGKLTPHTLPALLRTLKARHIHSIARIVTFKDSVLAKARPDLAAKFHHSDEIWRDAQHKAWVDPFQQEVWAYNLEIAVEASRLGFDEILFDGAHFPQPGLNGRPRFSHPLTIENRLETVTGFLSAARGQLSATGVKIGAALTGYACWRQDDNLIGQNIERMAPYLDILYPFLFPSAFVNGIPGCKNTADCAYQIVAQSTQQAVDRLKVINNHCYVRPWLQDFQDTLFNGKNLVPIDIQAQIRGALDGGASGFMVWDPKMAYTETTSLMARLSGE